MPNPDIAFLSAAKTAQAIKNKQFSPTEAVQAYLDRIDQLDSTLHGYIAWALQAKQMLRVAHAYEQATPWHTRCAPMAEL